LLWRFSDEREEAVLVQLRDALGIDLLELLEAGIGAHDDVRKCLGDALGDLAPILFNELPAVIAIQRFEHACDEEHLAPEAPGLSLG
jgi:hypothetical protein